MSSQTNPVLVEVTRGDLVESQHRGAACVCDHEGELVMAWGDVETPVFPRSAVKPLQAIPFVETGAADFWKATAQELALACASHSGEPAHISVAQTWVDKLGLPPQALACGAHPPLGAVAAEGLIATGRSPGPLHNNCSGKHLAMMSTALFQKETVENYQMPDHPAQVRVRGVLSEMAGIDLSSAPAPHDGCDVPTYAMPLSALARAFARFADTRKLPVFRQSAIRRLKVAIAIHRNLIAGTDRFDTILMGRKGPNAIVKGGAEGIHAAALPGLGLGIAVKIDDGAQRASEVVMSWLLRYLEVLDDMDWAALGAAVSPVLMNSAGRKVGEIRLAPGWLGQS